MLSLLGVNRIENTTTHATISEALRALEEAMHVEPEQRFTVFVAGPREHLLVRGDAVAEEGWTRVAAYYPAV